MVGLKLGSHDLVVGMESDKVELVTGQKEVCCPLSLIDPCLKKGCLAISFSKN